MKRFIFALTLLLSTVGTAYSSDIGTTKIIDGHEVQVLGENQTHIFVKRQLLGEMRNGMYDKRDKFFFFHQIKKTGKKNIFIFDTIGFMGKSNPDPDFGRGKPMSLRSQFKFSCSKRASIGVDSYLTNQFYGQGKIIGVDFSNGVTSTGETLVWTPFSNDMPEHFMPMVRFCDQLK